MNDDFLHELLKTPSVSGHEEAIQEKALKYSADFADRQETDAAGNALHILNPDADFKLLLMGHIDEIGYLVTHIDDQGFIRVMENGGMRNAIYVGAPMLIIHEGTPVNAVVAVTKELMKSSEVKAESLILDIGAKNKEEALKMVSVGDPVLQDAEPRGLLSGRFSARAMDDRTGAFVVLEALRRAKEKGSKIGVVAATTVGEETSGRGAYYATSSVKPALAIAVDVTYVSDCPGTDPGSTGEVGLGKGPVLCKATIVNKNVNKLLVEIAEEKGMNIQWEVASGRTGTDADTALRVNAGTPVALVSIPLRYMHSSVEVAEYKDLEDCIELLSELAVRLTPDFEFKTIQPLC